MNVVWRRVRKEESSLIPLRIVNLSIQGLMLFECRGNPCCEVKSLAVRSNAKHRPIWQNGTTATCIYVSGHYKLFMILRCTINDIFMSGALIEISLAMISRKPQLIQTLISSHNIPYPILKAITILTYDWLIYIAKLNGLLSLSKVLCIQIRDLLFKSFHRKMI